MTQTVIHGDSLEEAYLAAQTVVRECGYAEEVEWQRSRDLGAVTESDLLREHAWVALNSGMREVVVRSKWPAFSAAFGDWPSAWWVCEHTECCEADALRVFGHVGKVRAITQTARLVYAEGWAVWRARLLRDSLTALRSLPFIGPVTVYHLAKNLGAQVVKPDRHLVRIAEVAGFASPLALCEAIAAFSGDPLPVVDLTLWRFATLRPGCYLQVFGVTPEPEPELNLVGE